MKREPKRGKSARRGNMPSPYTKYEKVPYRYTGLNRPVNYRPTEQKPFVRFIRGRR